MCAVTSVERTMPPGVRHQARLLSVTAEWHPTRTSTKLRCRNPVQSSEWRVWCYAVVQQKNASGHVAPGFMGKCQVPPPFRQHGSSFPGSAPLKVDLSPRFFG